MRKGSEKEYIYIYIHTHTWFPWWLSSKAANIETWVQSLGWEDLLGKEMATHSSILAWKIPWTEKPGGLQSMRSQKSQIQLSD